MIKIENIHKSFDKKVVLKSINLQINDGKTFCIIGKSGSGKSVLLKIIVGLLEPDYGNVYVDNLNINSLGKKELFNLRRKFGFVFQGSALFDSLTVYENIILSLYEHGERNEKVLTEEAIRVLTAVSLLPDPNFVSGEAFEKEWKILKDKKPADLSGGMKKRVGVARALVGKPNYIFYDEPTTGLDPITSEQIDNLIAELSQKLKITSLVITHDLFSVVKIADEVALLNDGIVQFYGTPAQLKQSDDPIVVEFLQRYKTKV